MAITVERLHQASQIEPADLGEEIVDPEISDAAQHAAMLAWLDENVLQVADSEVSVPLMKVTGYDDVAGFINGRFPDLAEVTREQWIAKGNALYDGAVLSYGRSEINKCINSNSEAYDKDSDQDRIHGNQRLQKLLDWAQILIETGGSGSSGNNGSVINAYTQTVRVRRRYC